MLQRLLTLARIFSLDVVLGACVGNLFMAYYLRVEVPLSHLLALALTVWLIYTADHLADAYQIKHPAHSLRHLYHQHHFRTVGMVFLVVMLIGCAVVFNLSQRVMVWGLLLLGLVGCYFLLIKLIPENNYYYKEFMIAFLYSTGIFLSPLSLYQDAFSGEILFVFGQYTLIALTNLLIFALYEVDLDKKDGHQSFVKLAGQAQTRRLIYACSWLTGLPALAGLVLLPVTQRLFTVQLLFLIMTVTLVIIMLFPAFFQPKERYRIVGDGVFLLPLFVLLS